MARITVEDCLEKIENQYDLVLLAKERTLQLNSGAEILVNEDNDKRTVIALREIGDGKISTDELKKDSVNRLRKEPDEVIEEQEVEEVTDDSFEKEYKGEVSKSGIAILPSKRTRKIPIQNNSNTEEKKQEDQPLKLTEEIDVQEEKK